MSTDSTAQVFISHSARDKATADAACAALEGAGIRCWIAPRDVIPGSSYPAEIIRGIEGCQIMLFIFTAHSNESRAVHKELERGVNRGKVIMPFRMEEVTACPAVDYLIANEHWLDATNPPLAERLDELVTAVQGQLARRQPAAATTPAAPAPAVVSRPTPTSAPRKHPLLSPALLLALVVLLAAGGFFGVRYWRSRQVPVESTAAAPEPTTPVLVSPAEGEVIVGSDQRPNLLLEFRLPEKRNRSARIEIQPEGQAVQPPVVWASSTFLVTGVEGPMRWRVQASWKNEAGAVESGAWSEWRSVTFYPHRLSRMLHTGRCVLGTADVSPTDKLINFDPATLNPGGYEIELLRAFFRAQKPKQEVTISFQQQPEGWGEKYFHMLANEPDVDFLVSGITPTPEREKAWGVVFAVPNFKFHQVLLTRKGEPAVKEGQVVANILGAAANTTNADFLLRLLGGPGPRVNIDPGPKSYQSLVNGLAAGRIDAFLVDEVYLPALYKSFPNLPAETEVTKLRPAENPAFELSGAAWAFRPEDRPLRAAIDDFLRKNPEERRRLQEQFFPGLEFIP